MTASLTAGITAEQIIAFVTVSGEATSHQVADHFHIRWAAASSRLSRLAAYGRLRRRYAPRYPCGVCAIWSAL